MIDVSRFIPIELFKQRMDQMINDIKSSPKAVGVEEIFLPGEIEFAKEAVRLEKGIELLLHQEKLCN